MFFPYKHANNHSLYYRKNARKCRYLHNGHVIENIISLKQSVHVFGFLIGFLIFGDISECDTLLQLAFKVTRFSFHVEANHQLVDHHTHDGSKEWGTDRNQEPPISNSEERPKK